MASNQPNTVQGQPSFQVRLAKPGFNVSTATDYELLFSSAWPSLAVAFAQAVTIVPGGLGPGVGTLAHPLNFIPFTMVWVIEKGVVTRRTFPDISATTIYINDINATGTTTYFVQCYNLDITKQVSYSFVAPPPVGIGVYDPHYAYKFAKPGKTASSNKLNDYIVHSQAQSPALLNVVTTFDKTPAVVSSQTITYRSPRNYIPWVFGYSASIFAGAPLYTWAPPYAQAPPRLFINLVANNSFTLSCDSTATGGSLIVLRDPLFVPNTVQVTYG